MSRVRKNLAERIGTRLQNCAADWYWKAGGTILRVPVNRATKTLLLICWRMGCLCSSGIFYLLTMDIWS